MYKFKRLEWNTDRVNILKLDIKVDKLKYPVHYFEYTEFDPAMRHEFDPAMKHELYEAKVQRIHIHEYSRTDRANIVLDRDLQELIHFYVKEATIERDNNYTKLSKRFEAYIKSKWYIRLYRVFRPY